MYSKLNSNHPSSFLLLQEWSIRDSSKSPGGGGGRVALYNMAAGMCLQVELRRTGGKLTLDVCTDEVRGEEDQDKK